MPLETIWPYGKADYSRRASASDVAGGYTQFRNGDVLLPKITPTFEAGRAIVAEISTPLGAGTTELHVLRANSGVDSRFIAYLLRSLPFLQEGAATLQGVGNLRRVPRDWLSKFPVLVADVASQRAIADYLDRETQKIDELIAEQRGLIETLRERRHSLRTEVALRGIDGERTSWSSLPWARSLPESWQVVPLSAVSSIESGHTPSRSRPEWWTDTYIPWISLHDVSNMRTSKYVQSTVHQVSDAGIANSSARILPAGTVVLSRDATVGRTAIMSVPMATSQHFGAWICGHHLNPEYLWVLFSDAMQAHFESFQNGATLRTIGMNDMKSFRIPLPPIEEQSRIVEYLDVKTARIDELISESEELIALSQERRAALIAAAVTGQIDVRTAS